MTPFRLVHCFAVALLVASAVGRELPIERIVDPATNHRHTAGHHRSHPKSCLDMPHRPSGVYLVQPEWPYHDPMLVYCEQEYDAGGWTVIQRRIDGTLNFDRPEKDYRFGFGNLDAEFWAGLENIYRLVNSCPHELAILLEDFAGNSSYARYGHFELYKSEQFIIPQYFFRKLSPYDGTAGNFMTESVNVAFKYKDLKTGFWMNGDSNLNGKYFLPNETKGLKEGLHWGNIKTGSIKATHMLIRPTSNNG